MYAKLSRGNVIPTVKRKLASPKSLKAIIQEKFKSVRKEILNEATAHIGWEQRYKQWQENNPSPISIDELTKNGFTTKYNWYTCPDTIDGNILLRFLDHHHLLTNCRLHCCRKGFKTMNINPEAWLRVAKTCKTNGTGLNIAYVEDQIDPQSNLVAQLTFSEKVETVMISNNDLSEAQFCKLIREWYEAVDEKGLEAKERVKRLLNLREYLLDSSASSLKSFPPPGAHVSGMPVALFTGLLTSCEKLIHLYKQSNTGTYNVRSIGSLDNETFFSSFRDLDPRGTGVLRTHEVPKAMSIACEILTTRMNPDRGFFFKTTTKLPVYNEQCIDSDITDAIDEEDHACHTFRNHQVFDQPLTEKRATKRKNATINPFDGYAHGARGIRQYHRRDEEKILPHKRACLDL